MGGRIKGLLSQHIYSKRESWKAALCLTETGQKAAHQRKSTTDKKARTLTLNSGCCCRREGWWWWLWRWVKTRRADHKSMWQRFGVWGLSLKNGVKCPYCKGGLVFSRHLITWYGNRQSTRHLPWVIGPTRRTARNFQHFHMTAVHQIHVVHYYYFDWGRRQ